MPKVLCLLPQNGVFATTPHVSAIEWQIVMQSSCQAVKLLDVYSRTVR